MAIEYIYEWEWRTTATMPPPQRLAGSNNTAWAGARSLYMSATNNASVDVAAILRMMKRGDTVKIEHKTTAGIWAEYRLDTEPVDYSGYFTFPCTLTRPASGAPVNNIIYKYTLSLGAVTSRSVTQLTSCAGLTGANSFWYAIYCTCSDQTIWTMGDDHVWRQLPSLPQPEAPTS